MVTFCSTEPDIAPVKATDRRLLKWQLPGFDLENCSVQLVTSTPGGTTTRFPMGIVEPDHVTWFFDGPLRAWAPGSRIKIEFEVTGPAGSYFINVPSEGFCYIEVGATI